MAESLDFFTFREEPVCVQKALRTTVEASAPSSSQALSSEELIPSPRSLLPPITVSRSPPRSLEDSSVVHDENNDGKNTGAIIQSGNTDAAFAGLVAGMIELKKRQKQQQPVPVTLATSNRDSDVPWMLENFPSHQHDVRLWLYSKRTRNDRGNKVETCNNIWEHSQCSCCSSTSTCSWGLVLRKSLSQAPQQKKRRTADNT
mmetsp:Transcript_24693/g.52176  ORF Transcript_24693/g.52176 Transcript_24693/m.52176 type:complete len:202 (-) Transcript_24693:191-796(-)